MQSAALTFGWNGGCAEAADDCGKRDILFRRAIDASDESGVVTPLALRVPYGRLLVQPIGNKIGGRIRLSPAVMEATHDIDFILWCLEGTKPVRVYSEVVYRIMEQTHGVPDCQWIMVTMEDGTVFTIGAGWALPPGYPHFSTTTIEFVATEGALLIDDTHRDVVLNTLQRGMVFPLSTMPGEQVAHVYQGPMEAETIHFIEAVALDHSVLVTPEQGRQVMEVTLAADLSAERHQPVSLPLEP